MTCSSSLKSGESLSPKRFASRANGFRGPDTSRKQAWPGARAGAACRSLEFKAVGAALSEQHEILAALGDLSAVLRCRIIGRLVGELFDLACATQLPKGTAERRPQCHIRQITMYLCRVVLSMSYTSIGQAMGRDRSTVVHACAVIEDRRDDAAYDAFMERCERCVMAVFSPVGGIDDEM